MPDGDLLGEVDPAILVQSAGDGLWQVSGDRLIDVQPAGLAQHHCNGGVVQLVDTGDEEGCLFDHLIT